MPQSEGIYYTLSGKGKCSFPPLILIHGEGANQQVWSFEIRRLSGYQILAIDLPGHGRSEGAACQSVKAYSNRLIIFLENLKLPKVILVGHGLGGAVALMTAIQPLDVAAGVGCISSGSFLGGETDILKELSTPFGFARALQLIHDQSFSHFASPETVKNAMQMFAKVRRSVLYSDWQACADFDLRTELGKLKVPLWAAVGEEDQLTPPTFSRYLVDQVPGSTLQIIPAAGHMIPLENKTELTLGLQAFLERIEFNRRNEGIYDTFINNEYSDHDSNMAAFG